LCEEGRGRITGTERSGSWAIRAQHCPCACKLSFVCAGYLRKSKKSKKGNSRRLLPLNRQALCGKCFYKRKAHHTSGVQVVWWKEEPAISRGSKLLAKLLASGS